MWCPINKPLTGPVSQCSGKSCAILENYKSLLLLPIAQIENPLLEALGGAELFSGIAAVTETP